MALGRIIGGVIIFFKERPINCKICSYGNIASISYSWSRRRWKIIDNWFWYGWLEHIFF